MSSLRSKLSRLQIPGARPRGTGVFEPEAPPDAVVSEAEDSTEAADDVAPGTERPFERLDHSTRIQRLRAQMASLQRVEGAQRGTPRPAGGSDAAAARGRYTLGEGLPGQRIEHAAGLLRCVRTELAVDHRHGVVPVAGALDACPRELAVLALDPSIAGIDFSRALYIDTETTGLAGGAGTIPFLIGVAFFESGRLVVEQYLLEQLGQEGPMLARLEEHLRWASCVVSYNGKSFDWPLLRTRFVLHRVPVKPPAVHLDLLHCARRVFKRRLGAVRLVHIEEEVLGFTRVDDIPGSQIPETYLGYLRQRVPGEALGPIVEHNRSDLVALAALLGELSRRFKSDGQGQDARDQLGMAQVAARAHQTGRAILLARSALDADMRGELSSQAAWLAGRWAKQQGDFEGAQRGFTQAVECARDPGEAARAHLELAKLFEHQLRCLETALVHAACTAPEEGDGACAKRVGRLQRKLVRLAR